MAKKNKALDTCGTPVDAPIYILWENQKVKREEKYIGDTKFQNFPNLMKNINLHIQENQQTPRSINSKKCILRP